MLKQTQHSGRRILVFDVNETLLDVNALQPQFEPIFKGSRVLKQWFSQVLLYSQTVTQTGEYADFGKIGRAALEMIGEIHGINVTEETVRNVISAMRSLPPHPEVSEQIARLRANGFRIVALTNSPQEAAKEQIENAGLSSLFEKVFSVDAVRKYKPAAEAYMHVASELHVSTSQLTMIASHPWDLMGARAAGCEIAFIQRPGTAWFPLVPPPAIRGENLRGVADQLITGDMKTPQKP